MEWSISLFDLHTKNFISFFCFLHNLFCSVFVSIPRHEFWIHLSMVFSLLEIRRNEHFGRYFGLTFSRNISCEFIFALSARCRFKRIIYFFIFGWNLCHGRKVHKKWRKKVRFFFCSSVSTKKIHRPTTPERSINKNQREWRVSIQ